MTAILSLYDRLVALLEDQFGPMIMPILARLIFAGTLFMYYWQSAMTKLGSGFGGLFEPSFAAYTQILPRVYEAAGYDASQLGLIAKLVVLFGTWAEIILPILLIIGLFTRIAALGMIGFVIAQSWVDIFGHHVDAATRGSWFDAASGGLILDQRAFWIFLLLYLAVKGGGALALDAVLRRNPA